jgi:hypothetical protein
MIENRLIEDYLVTFLLKNSSITACQLDTAIIEKLNIDETLSIKVTMRDKKTVSKGAYIRSLDQYKKNIKKSIYTLLLNEYLGLSEQGTIKGLLEISSIINRINYKTIEKETITKVINEISKTINKIVEGTINY